MYIYLQIFFVNFENMLKLSKTSVGNQKKFCFTCNLNIYIIIYK